MNTSHTNAEREFSAVFAPTQTPDDVLFPGTVLVVIDMQPGYPAALDAVTQWFVKQEVERHCAANLPILLVEFDAHEMG